MRYVITGHKGLIGDFLNQRLKAEGHECVAQIDQCEGFNVLDLERKEPEITGQVDVMFHLAAQCKINESIAKPILSHTNNADGILQVLEFCRRHNIKKVVVTSTSRVLSPERNPYVASKIYVEELVKAYHDCYDIDYIIIRPSTVYGPCFDETSRLMSNFIVNALRGEDLKVYGDEEKTLDFTYVSDFVNGVMLAFNKDAWNEEYNISGNEEEKIVEVAKEVIHQTNSSSKFSFYPPERAQPQKVKINTNKIKALGYEPKVNLKEGIAKMVVWYKEHPEAWNSYIDKGEKYYNGIREKGKTDESKQ